MNNVIQTASDNDVALELVQIGEKFVLHLKRAYDSSVFMTLHFSNELNALRGFIQECRNYGILRS